MRSEFGQKIGKLLSDRRRRRRLWTAVCVLAVCTAIGVYAALLRPAFSMESRNLIAEAETLYAQLGDTLSVRVTASAKKGQDETVFYLNMNGEAAGLSDTYVFTNGETAVTMENGGTLTLHRGADTTGGTGYWFTLKEGESAAFTLLCASGDKAIAVRTQTDASAASETSTTAEASAATETSAAADTSAASETSATADASATADTSATAETSAASETSAAAAAPDSYTLTIRTASAADRDTAAADAGRTDAASLTLQWMTAEALAKVEVPSITLSAAAQSAATDQELTVQISAKAPGSAAVFALESASNGPMLASRYAFVDGQMTVTDDAGTTLTLHREERDGGAVYWFQLSAGTSASFSLSFADAAGSSGESADIARVTLTSGTGDSLDAAEANAAGPLTLTWSDGIALSAVTEDGVTVTLTAPDTAFPGKTDLSLSVAKLTDEEAAAARQKLQDSMQENGQSLDGLLLYDIRVLSGGTEVQPAGAVTVTFTGLPASYTGKTNSVWYVSDDAATAENMNAETTGDGAVVMETTHFTNYGVAAASANGTAKTSLAVSKTWSDGASAHTGDSTTVHLCANGADTGLTLTLSAANSWQGTFSDLDAKDASGNDIDYTVREDAVSGYVASYAYGTAAGSGETYWETADSFTAGSRYMLVYDNGSKAVANVSDKTLTAADVTVTAVSGQSYFSITNSSGGAVGNTALWTASATAGISELTNLGTSKKLALHYRNDSVDFQASTKTDNRQYSMYYYYGQLYAYKEDNGSWTAYYMQNTGTATADENAATSYTLYKQISVASGSGTPTATITNRKATSISADEPRLTHSKTIDYLGDNNGTTDAKNPDTTLDDTSTDGLDDLYRVYLDISGQQEPIDLLLMIDRSGSMRQDLSTGSETITTKSRSQAVVDLLNDTGSGTGDGFISTFLGLNDENKISIAWFGGSTGNDTGNYDNAKDAGVAQSWTGTAFSVTNGTDTTAGNRQVGGIYNTGTNYTAAFWKIEDLLKDSSIASDGHKKVVVFLSDGEPTFYVYTGSTESSVASYADYLSGNATGTLKRGGTGRTDSANVTTSTARTRTAYSSMSSLFSGVTFNTIGYTTDAEAAGSLLYDMAASGGGAYYHASNASSLESALSALIWNSKASSVEMTDHVSSYVQWYGQQPDLKITRTNIATGAVTTLWEGSGTSGTIGAAAAGNTIDGTSVIQSVTYTPSSSGSSSGTLDVLFNPNFTMDNEYTYTVSYNVQVTQAAYTAFASSGYGDVTGDAGTDYGTNATSSSQSGFHANESAAVSYVIKEAAYSEAYKHPVVQVQARNLNILKKGSSSSGPALSGVGFALYKATVSGNTWTKAAEDSIASGTTGSDGTLVLPKLGYGTYLLYETSAKAGYKLPADPWRVTITKTAVTVTKSDGTAAATSNVGTVCYNILLNDTAYQLPHTGSSVLPLLYLFGAALTAGSGIGGVIYGRRRRGGRQNR